MARLEAEKEIHHHHCRSSNLSPLRVRPPSYNRKLPQVCKVPQLTLRAEERIHRFVIGDLRWEDNQGGDLTYDMSLLDGTMDSLGIVKTVSFLEADFGIEVSEDEISPENFETINALAEFVRRKTAIDP